MSSWGDSFDGWSSQVDSIQGTSSASNISSSGSSESDHSYQPGGQPGSGTPSSDAALTSHAAHSVTHALRTPSINSTSSEQLSYAVSAGSVLSTRPRFSAPWESRDHASSTSSSPYDSILGHFALHTPLASSAAPLSQQPSRPSTLSSDETTESDESAESNPNQADRALGTPATTDASQEADIQFAVAQDDEDQALAIPNELALVGLELQDEYRAEPLFCDANNTYPADIVNEILEIFQNEHANPQAEPDAIPWIPGAQDVRRSTCDDSTLAPPPGLAYHEYYSLTRKHVQRHKRHERNTQKKRKAILTSRKAQSTPLGFHYNSMVTGTPEYDPDISPYIATQCSTVGTESRNRRPQGWFDSNAEWLRAPSKRSQICRAVDCVTFSPETLGSIFYPSFALAHLSPSSLSTFTAKLVAPDGLAYHSEYSIDLDLGFGPTMSHEVCTFTPINKKDLQSYQKHQGEDKLHVQESLPIILNLFSVDSHAGELDTWLDRIIDSEFRLQEYIELMQRRQNGHLSVQILRCLVAWYSTSKNTISQLAHHTFRAALKLLMTTTLLSLVPKLKSIPESLFRCLSPQPSALHSTYLSTVAPKLLTRQIKASIHHLQHDLLHALFCYFACRLRLATEVKVAVALLLACVLEFARNAGRQFAKFASTIDSTVVVKPQDVTQYEMSMQRQVFDRVRTSVLDTAGEIGQLGEGLRNIGSIAKGKGKEDESCQFVSVILNTVL